MWPLLCSAYVLVGRCTAMKQRGNSRLLHLRETRAGADREPALGCPQPPGAQHRLAVTIPPTDPAPPCLVQQAGAAALSSGGAHAPTWTVGTQLTSRQDQPLPPARPGGSSRSLVLGNQERAGFSTSCSLDPERMVEAPHSPAPK